MKFEMNNRKWEIIEADQKEICEVEGISENNVDKFFGLCCYDKQIIYLWKELNQEQKRETLMHELLHCYMGCYCSFEDVVWNTDLVCNICANSHDIIHEIVEKYFNRAIIENKPNIPPEDVYKIVKKGAKILNRR